MFVGCISAFRHKRYMCKHGLGDVLGMQLFKMKLDSQMRFLDVQVRVTKKLVSHIHH